MVGVTNREHLAELAEQRRKERARYDGCVLEVLTKLCAGDKAGEVQLSALQHGLKMKREANDRVRVRCALRRLKVAGRVVFRTVQAGRARCFYKPRARQ